MSWWSSKKDESSFDAGSSSFDDGSSNYDFSSANDFSSPGALSSPGAGGAGGGQERLQQALLAEQQRLEVQRMVMKMADLCFDKCVKRPSDKLSGSESSCINNCSERYLDSKMFVTNRLVKQHQGQQ